MEDQGSVRFPSCTNSHSHLSYHTSAFGPIETCSPVLKSHITQDAANVLQLARSPIGLAFQTPRNDLLFTFWWDGPTWEFASLNWNKHRSALVTASDNCQNIFKKKKKPHQQTRHSSHIYIFWYERRLNAENSNIQQIWTLALKGEMPNSSKSSLNYIFAAAAPDDLYAGQDGSTAAPLWIETLSCVVSLLDK